METKKIVLIGDSKVGKTSFVRKLAGREVLENYSPTLGVEVTPIIRNEKCFNIWDCAGNWGFRGLGEGYWVQADGAIIMAECVNSETVLSIESWYSQLQRIIGNKPILAVLNKCEILDAEERIALEGALLDVVFISSKEDINVEEVLKNFY